MIFVVHFLGSVYSLATGALVGLSIILLTVLIFSARIRHSINRIESTFFNNLNERDLSRSGRNNSLVANLHLAYMKVGYSSPFVGERLMDTKLHSRYDVNVVSIQRGARFLPAPSGHNHLFPGDVIGVIGTDDHLQQLLPLVETADTLESAHNPADFRLMSFILSHNSVLVGHTPAELDLRGNYSTMIVAVKRRDTMIPDPGNTTFEEGDTVWAVTTAATVAKLS